jgi:hypothetical protein
MEAEILVAYLKWQFLAINLGCKSIIRCPNLRYLPLMFIILFGILIVIPGNRQETYGGDTITVPISWCAINGSRAAEDDPNIPNPYGGVDHTTDEVLWRRHERATDHIYNNNPLNGGTQAVISFRSGINDALHTTLNFPKINDPNPTAIPGDINLDANLGQEYTDMLIACQAEWANMSVKHPGVVSGIFAFNVRLTVNNAGDIVDTIGSGWCTRNVSNKCVPYDGHMYVIDNSFMLYGISSGLPTPQTWMNKDEFDQSVSHELAHALNLNHRNGDTLALMNTNQQHNGPNGRVSNLKIYPGEITEIRDTPINPLNNIPGAYMDPDNKIILGSTVKTIKVDEVKENKTLKPYEDIAITSVTLDKNANKVYFGLQLYGLLPKKSSLQNQSTAEYWTLLDLDNDKNTGGNKDMLTEIGFSGANVSGIDLAIFEKGSNINLTSGNNIIGNAWFLNSNNVMNLSSDKVRFDLHTASIHRDHAVATKKMSEPEIPLYDTIYATLNNTNLVKLDSPFSVQSFVISNKVLVDSLEYKDNEPRIQELSQPTFPVCFTNHEGMDGQNITVNTSGLLPNSNLHALLGTRLVANGTTDASGNATIDFIIPKDTSEGLHLMTVGVDNTALTSDCQIKVHDRNKMQD